MGIYKWCYSQASTVVKMEITGLRTEFAMCVYISRSKLVLKRMIWGANNVGCFVLDGAKLPGRFFCIHSGK